MYVHTFIPCQLINMYLYIISYLISIKVNDYEVCYIYVFFISVDEPS